MPSEPRQRPTREESDVYEARHQPLLPRAIFLRRVARHLGLAAAVLAVSLMAGMLGYHAFEGLSWLDGFLNSAMLLGGMGPVNPPLTAAGKLFAGIYALYAGLVFIVTAALVVTPVLHRVLHRFHLGDAG
jgi:hypothetical protein